MSENKNAEPRVARGEDVPRMEPWLAVSLLALVPGIGLFILPPAAMVPLYIVMAVLMTTGIGMFLRSEWTKPKE